MVTSSGLARSSVCWLQGRDGGAEAAQLLANCAFELELSIGSIVISPEILDFQFHWRVGGKLIRKP